MRKVKTKVHKLLMPFDIIISQANNTNWFDYLSVLAMIFGFSMGLGMGSLSLNNMLTDNLPGLMST